MIYGTPSQVISLIHSDHIQDKTNPTSEGYSWSFHTYLNVILEKKLAVSSGLGFVLLGFWNSPCSTIMVVGLIRHMAWKMMCNAHDERQESEEMNAYNHMYTHPCSPCHIYHYKHHFEEKLTYLETHLWNDHNVSTFNVSTFCRDCFTNLSPIHSILLQYERTGDQEQRILYICIIVLWMKPFLIVMYAWIQVMLGRYSWQE